ncbi:MAG: imidazoleglycerol-phosphate dehydratase [Candidatus Omnitrophica bacterium]|nr:imidazoleglycerol-phosphate dehydratase [Candidatus Omnitrophota bacterium]
MRKAQVKRDTKETKIAVTVNIDGSGKTKIKTGIGMLDHLLELFAFHGLFDLTVMATGDFNVDIHHTNEDVGIVLGDAFKKALGTKKGIRRCANFSWPMEEVLASVALDISGRGSFVLRPKKGATTPQPQDGYALKDAEHFFEAFAKRLGMDLSITIEPMVSDLHTTLEPAFKALGKALDEATQLDPRRSGVPSTKGVID